jgi:CBS domain-containing protein
MQIKDVMTEKVDLVNPTTTLADAARKMREDDVGALPVGEGDDLVGMITDRDITVRAIAEGKDPAATTVRDAMSEDVLYCFEDQSTEEVAANMGAQQIRRLPVVNRDKRLVGIVSLGDLSSSSARREAGEALGRISEPAH